MVCPKCNGNNVNIQLRSSGTESRINRYRTGVKSSWFIPAGQSSRKSKRNYKSIAVCQNCGYTWEVKQPAKISDYIVGTVALVLIVSVAMRACSGERAENPVNQPQEDTSVWATEYTPLEDFDYYIDANQIYLKEYNGKSDKVYIAPQYERNGNTLKVVSLDGAMFFGSVDSIIISEGVENVSRAAFNGSGVKYLYFPSTVTDFDGFSYIHKGETLYYSGTEEMWAALYTDDRSDLDFVEVVCNATVDSLPG